VVAELVVAMHNNQIQKETLVVTVVELQDKEL
jgi:hypothetical protein